MKTGASFSKTFVDLALKHHRRKVSVDYVSRKLRLTPSHVRRVLSAARRSVEDNPYQTEIGLTLLLKLLKKQHRTIKVQQPTQMQIRFWLGVAHYWRYDFETSHRIFKNILPYFEENGPDEILARIHLFIPETGTQADFSVSFNYMARALRTATRLKDRALEVEVLNFKANYHMLSGEFGPKVTRLLNRALRINRTVKNNKLAAMTYYMLSFHTLRHGKIELSLKQALKAHELARKAGTQLWLDFISNNLGVIYRNLGFYERALVYLTEGIASDEANRKYVTLIPRLTNIGIIYNMLQDRKKALVYLNKAIRYARSIRYNLYEAIAYYRVSDVYTSLKKPREAIEFASRSLKIFEDNDVQSYICSVLKTLGEAYLETGRFKKARTYLERGLGILQDQKTELDIESCYLALLSDIEVHDGNYAIAEQLLEKALRLDVKAGNVEKQMERYFKLGIFYSKYKVDHLRSYRNFEHGSDIAQQFWRNFSNEKEKLMQISTSKSDLISLYDSIFNKYIGYVQNIETKLKTASREIANAFQTIESQKQKIQKQRDRLRVTNKQVASSYKNITVLSEIGQRITGSLDFDRILRTVYESVNALMNASIFGIGLYDKKASVILNSLFIEQGNRIQPFETPLSNKGSLGVWCLKHRKEIVMNDVQKEYKSYVGKRLVVGARPAKSIIYLPLVVEDRAVGVITVQSFKKNAYREYDLNILRTLATYTAIALDNAGAYEAVQRANRRLRSTQNQLIQTEKMASLGQIIAGVSHEINNPLTLIYSNIFYLEKSFEELEGKIEAMKSLAEKKHDSPDLKALSRATAKNIGDTKNILDSITAGSKRVKDVVKHLQDFSMLNESAYRLADVHECLNDAISLSAAQHPNIKIHRSYGKLPEIHCFPSDLSTMFNALITNSIQAIEEVRETGTIRITTKFEKRRKGEEGGSFIVIKLKDNGSGIPKKLKEKVFEPFFTTREIGQGRGLGLYVGYGIVQKHHGRIFFESKQRAGTEFTVEIPMA